jgi:hypothetical protein
MMKDLLRLIIKFFVCSAVGLVIVVYLAPNGGYGTLGGLFGVFIGLLTMFAVAVWARHDLMGRRP